MHSAEVAYRDKHLPYTRGDGHEDRKVEHRCVARAGRSCQQREHHQRDAMLIDRYRDTYTIYGELSGEVAPTLRRRIRALIWTRQNG